MVDKGPQGIREAIVRLLSLRLSPAVDWPIRTAGVFGGLFTYIKRPGSTGLRGYTITVCYCAVVNKWWYGHPGALAISSSGGVNREQHLRLTTVPLTGRDLLGPERPESIR